MVLFVGGPADGKRVEVPNNVTTVMVPINPHPPTFTPDSAVLSATTMPKCGYKQEIITVGNEQYRVFIPMDWNITRLIEELLLNYKPTPERQDYIRTAKGIMYDNDDRSPDGRPYKL